MINGLHVYMDNYYSSPRLFFILAKMAVLACGTMRSNRTGWPKQVLPEYHITLHTLN